MLIQKPSKRIGSAIIASLSLTALALQSSECLGKQEQSSVASTNQAAKDNLTRPLEDTVTQSATKPAAPLPEAKWMVGIYNKLNMASPIERMGLAQVDGIEVKADGNRVTVKFHLLNQSPTKDEKKFLLHLALYSGYQLKLCENECDLDNTCSTVVLEGTPYGSFTIDLVKTGPNPENAAIFIEPVNWKFFDVSFPDGNKHAEKAAKTMTRYAASGTFRTGSRVEGGKIVAIEFLKAIALDEPEIVDGDYRLVNGRVCIKEPPVSRAGQTHIKMVCGFGLVNVIQD